MALWSCQRFSELSLEIYKLILKAKVVSLANIAHFIGSTAYPDHLPWNSYLPFLSFVWKLFPCVNHIKKILFQHAYNDLEFSLPKQVFEI